MTTGRSHWNRTHPGLTGLRRAIDPVRRRIVTHELYRTLDDLERVRVFLDIHVFAVWDFMCLLKSLQRHLTCVELPWLPTGPATGRRLINEIVLAEESDVRGDGHISRFELYLEAMAQAGADTGPVESFLDLLTEGAGVCDAAKLTGLPDGAAEFLATTWWIIESAPAHCQAAAFAFGREELIPDIFEQVIGIEDENGTLEVFKDYLARHIEIDGRQHTSTAMLVLIDLCGDDAEKWEACARTVRAALEARVTLWDSIVAAFPAR